MSRPPETYSTFEAARRLGISIQSVQRWVDAGHLVAWKTVGGHRRIDARSVEQFIETQRGAGAAPTGLKTQPSNALTVLVVDDRADDRDILVHLVRAALPEAEVSTAESGFHALVAVGQRPRDIVIADIVMPNMNGFEMLQHIARDCFVPPRLVAAVSSHTEQEIATMGQLPAEAVFFQKPIDRRAFVDWLSTAGRALVG